MHPEQEAVLSLHFLLERVGQRSRIGKVQKYLLLPALPCELLFDSLWDAVWLALLGRLRRDRPYVFAWMNETYYAADLRPDDARYLQSLPRLWDNNERGVRPIRYVGVDDASLYIPASEDGGVTFLPHPPPRVNPGWQEIITELNGVSVSICDEFIVLNTVDPPLMDLLDSLPMLQDDKWNEAIEWRRRHQG